MEKETVHLWCRNQKEREREREKEREGSIAKQE
jgi:hypothetical protein